MSVSMFVSLCVVDGSDIDGFVRRSGVLCVPFKANKNLNWNTGNLVTFSKIKKLLYSIIYAY